MGPHAYAISLLLFQEQIYFHFYLLKKGEGWDGEKAKEREGAKKGRRTGRSMRGGREIRGDGKR